MKSTSTPLRAARASARASGEHGFSLLEVIVALAIMAAGFTAVLNLFSSSIRSVGMSDQYLQAVTLANSKLSEMELLDFKTETTSGVFEKESRFRWDMTVRPHDTPLNDPQANIRLSEVRMNVHWQEGKKNRSVQLATLKMDGTKRPGSDATLLAVFSGGAAPPADTPPEEEPGDKPEAPSFAPPGSGADPCEGRQHVSGASFGCGAPKQHISGN